MGKARSTADLINLVITPGIAGVVGDGVANDLPALQALFDAAEAAGRDVHLRPGLYALNGTLLIPHNMRVTGSGAKRSRFIAHPDLAPGAATYLVKVKQNTGAPGADNNFFVNWSDFGIYGQKRANVGCLLFNAGGGSTLERMYIVDGGSGVEQVKIGSDVAPNNSALVATRFSNVWFGSTDTSPACQNGVLVESAYSLHFDSCIFDYLSTGVSGTDGFAIKVRNSVGVVFNAINCEGNPPPLLIDNSSNVNLIGGAVYRRGLGSSPSTAADFAIEVVGSANNMPNILGTRFFQGYGSDGGSGGIAKINGGASLALASSTNDELTYFNTRALTLAGGARLPNANDTGASVLDWYEERDFSANIGVAGLTTAGAATIATAVGRATRIGNVVHFSINVSYTLSGAAGDLAVTGLPWPAINAVGYRAYCTARGSDLIYSNTLLAFITGSESQVRLSTMSSAAANAALAVDDAATITIAGTYHVA